MFQNVKHLILKLIMLNQTNIHFPPRSAVLFSVTRLFAVPFHGTAQHSTHIKQHPPSSFAK